GTASGFASVTRLPNCRIGGLADCGIRNHNNAQAARSGLETRQAASPREFFLMPYESPLMTSTPAHASAAVRPLHTAGGARHCRRARQNHARFAAARG